MDKNNTKKIYLNSKCSIKCQVAFVIKSCGCKALYMPFSGCVLKYLLVDFNIVSNIIVYMK